MSSVTIGDRWLCAWQVAPGTMWIQSRDPQFAGKLSRRTDSRLVVRGVAGGYLRTFEFRHGLTWARRLIDRYIQNFVVTNRPKTALISPDSAFLEKSGSRQREATATP